MLLVIESITVISILLVIYHHVGYPLILKYLAKEPASCNTSEITGDVQDCPEITILMPAYNEARYIAEKIRNLAMLDYPKDKYRVIVACDGCTDETVRIARQTMQEVECQELNISIHNIVANRGKVDVLNKFSPAIRNGLLAISDVSALLSIDALKITARRFQDKKIAVLTGRYCLLNPGSKGELAYWKYQTAIKQAEASLGATLGVHGAFYVVRAELVDKLPANTINDDFVLPMCIVAKGYRGIYEECIQAVELEHASSQTDLNRRRRIAAGNIQQLLWLRKLLLPRYRGIAFAFASGKALRVFMPFLMLLALAGSLFMASESWLYAAIATGQILLYGFVAAYYLIKPVRGLRLVQSLQYLVTGHVQSMIGVLRYMAGLESGRWHRVNSSGENT